MGASVVLLMVSIFVGALITGMLILFLGGILGEVEMSFRERHTITDVTLASNVYGVTNPVYLFDARLNMEVFCKGTDLKPSGLPALANGANWLDYQRQGEWYCIYGTLWNMVDILILIAGAFLIGGFIYRGWMAMMSSGRD